MSQGYKLALVLNDGEVQFQNVTINIAGNELDTSSSINHDGEFNAGYTDSDGDLLTAFIEIDTIIKDQRVMAAMATFKARTRYPYTDWYAYYALDGDAFNPDLEWYGTGIFVGDHNMTFNIPGAARLRMNFKSLQGGFWVPGDNVSLPPGDIDTPNMPPADQFGEESGEVATDPGGLVDMGYGDS